MARQAAGGDGRGMASEGAGASGKGGGGKGGQISVGQVSGSQVGWAGQQARRDVSQGRLTQDVQHASEERIARSAGKSNHTWL